VPLSKSYNLVSLGCAFLDAKQKSIKKVSLQRKSLQSVCSDESCGVVERIAVIEEAITD